MDASLPSPFAIAHRAGNDLDLLNRAEAAGVDFVEADVWLHRGRLEIRHLKTLGPVPVLWDRWRIASAWAPRLQFADLLRELEPETGLLLDLKGRANHLPQAAIETIERFRTVRRVMVSSDNWRLLQPFRPHPTTVVFTVGSERQLQSILREPIRGDEEAITIHQRLLNPTVVATLSRKTTTLIAWNVNSPERLQQLLDWGVQGINSDELDLLAGLIQRRQTAADRPDRVP